MNRSDGGVKREEKENRGRGAGTQWQWGADGSWSHVKKEGQAGSGSRAALARVLGIFLLTIKTNRQLPAGVSRFVVCYIVDRISIAKKITLTVQKRINKREKRYRDTNLKAINLDWGSDSGVERKSRKNGESSAYDKTPYNNRRGWRIVAVCYNNPGFPPSHMCLENCGSHVAWIMFVLSTSFHTIPGDVHFLTLFRDLVRLSFLPVGYSTTQEQDIIYKWKDYSSISSLNV